MQRGTGNITDDTLLAAFGNASARREAVPAACQRCRSKKTKCNGARPCSSCVRSGSECTWVTAENETRHNALKRKHNELSHSLERVLEVHDRLINGSEHEASSTLGLLRQGNSYETVLARLGAGMQHAQLSSEHQAYRAWLVALSHSTASLPDLLHTAKVVLTNRASLTMPSLDAFAPFKDQIVTLAEIVGTMSKANPKLDAVSFAVSPRLTPPPCPFDGIHEGPPYWVPASPWLEGRNTDEGLSNLIWTFVSGINGYWRFLETDLFLWHMRSKDRKSTFCSPLLVNAVLGIASVGFRRPLAFREIRLADDVQMFSEHDEAFSQTGDLLSRGEQYHNEALRLWALEGHRPSLTNVQALQILAVGSAYRGQDRLGWGLMQAATSLNRLLVDELPSSTGEWSAKAYPRARACASACNVWIHAGFVLCNIRDCRSFVVEPDEHPTLGEILPDVTAYWIGQPSARGPVPFRYNLLAVKRQELGSFEADIIRLAFSDRERDRAFWLSLDDLESRMCAWYSRMPDALSYKCEMPPPVYELHFHYRYLQLLFHDQWSEILLAESEGELRYDRRSRTMAHALKAAAMLIDFRGRYSYKRTPPFIILLSAQTAFILLQSLQSDVRDPITATLSEEGGPTMSINPTVAFEECCKCLLACGTQFMHARAVTRMLHQTALKLNAYVPASVEQMLQIFGEVVWAPSDLKKINSMYPNFAKNIVPDVVGPYRSMESALRALENVLQ